MADTTTAQKEAPWHAAFPATKSNPDSVSKEELLAWLKEGQEGGKDFVLVDLRRTDYEGGTIRGSINLPAQSLYPTIPYLYNLFKAAGIKKVMWYCGEFSFSSLSFRILIFDLGSSQGRGSRAAAWFEDHLDSIGDKSMQSFIMAGGIKGWVGAGEDYINFVDGYEKEAWVKKA